MTLQLLRRDLKDSTEPAADLFPMTVERVDVLRGKSLEKFGTPERELGGAPGLEDLEDGTELDLEDEAE